MPAWFFDLCNLESGDAATLALARTTFRQYFPRGIQPNTPVGVLSKLAMAAATLGDADAVRVLVPNQIRAIVPERGTAYRNGGVLANRMTLREGLQALDAERLGRAAEALHLALLQSNPSAPGEDPVLRVFAAWPTQWNARYTLLGRGAFLVSSSIQNGQVEFVELESRAGADCRLRNPWQTGATVYRDGRKAETIHGPLLHFATRKGERLMLLPEGHSPVALRHAEAD
jgi:hypothetical protein